MFPTVLSNGYYLNLVTSQYKTNVVKTTGVLTLGSTTITGVVKTIGIQLGALVTGVGIPVGTKVVSISGSSVVISLPVTDGYIQPVLSFDLSGHGFDLGIWNSYVGTTVLSFYSGPSPKMFAWLDANLQLPQNVGACLQSFGAAFTLFSTDPTKQAYGVQLDALGAVLGQSRFVPVLTASVLNGGSGYSSGNVVTVAQGHGIGSGMTLQVTGVSSGLVTSLVMLTPGTGYSVGNASTTGGGTGLVVNLSYLVLNDSDYRTLLRCTVIKNHWNGQISSINNICIATTGVSYQVADVVTAVQPQAFEMTLSVSSINSFGGVTGIILTQFGVNYQAGLATTTGGHGSGLSIFLPAGSTALISNLKSTLQYLWQTVFNGTSGISILDDGATAIWNASGVMAAQVNFTFHAATTSMAITVLAVNGYLAPRPQGVSYNYVITLI